MDAKLFKHNCKLIITCINLKHYVMVGNIILPGYICAPYNTDINNLSVNQLVTIANYIKQYYGLRLSVNRVASIIIERSI